MICELCKKLISRTNQRKITHKNIALSNKMVLFCSKHCYQTWKTEIQRNEIHTYLIWYVKPRLNNRIHFEKRKIKLKGISHIYGSDITNSHFSIHLPLKNFEEKKNKDILKKNSH